ncbi:MAG: S-layer homology domain-containing protein [Clostridia bacterium]|nr:S-layer homology domain-containing protein [Clostridia bacterium]
MKKILSLLLATLLVASCIPAFSAEVSADIFTEQIVSPNDISAFEGGYTGYEKSKDVFDNKPAHVLKRTAAEETEKGFCYYRWSTLLDGNGELIPLDGANYIVIDYYYHSPDAKPALTDCVMQWTQVNVHGEKGGNTSFGVAVKSRNGIVANKWDKLVFPLGDAAADKIKGLGKDDTYYLRQIKLYPLISGVDMGKDDVLYTSFVTVQSWDPAVGKVISDRRVSFFANENDVASPEKALSVINTRDLEYYTLPEYSGSVPANMEFLFWKNTSDGKTYKPGTALQMREGKDLTFFPVFNFVFDFANYAEAYISGYTDGTFLPQNNISRAEAAKIIASIINPTGAALGECTFKDVPADAWYRPYVSTLEAYGALDIFGDTFSPDTKITRSEVVEIIYAIADKNRTGTKLSNVSDVSEKDRFYDAVMYAVSEGIIAGYDDGTFRPANNITRAETVTIINRFIGRVPNGAGESKFSDISAHWAKDQIIASASSSAEGAWTANTSKKAYELTGTTPEEYIKALHTQAAALNGDAIRAGIDTVAEQMKKDVLATKNTADYYGDKMTGFTYYISEKNGNDENDGRSPEKAFKTIAGLNAKLKFPKKGTSILFERGGIYRGQVNMLQGCIYGSYGEGEKPIITASARNYADASLWKETNVKNVYELTEKVANAGVVVFDHAPYDHGNYDALYGKNRYYGRHISSYSNLASDLEFFPTDDTVYLYSASGNPGTRFTSIEIGPKANVLSGSGTDVIVDNLSVRYTGAHGVGVTYGKNLTVTNCEFCWIGGSQMSSYINGGGSYGNAVQIYGSCDGYYVKNNWMYQIYDTAVTHQGIDYTMNNIEYSGNLMEYVHWGIECWITKQNKNPETNNYIAKYNVLRNIGYGWGSIVSNRQSSARLYSFTTVQAKNSNLRAEYNILDRSAGYLIDIDKNSCEEFSNNIYVQHKDGRLGTLKGTSASASYSSAKLITEKLKDASPFFVLVTQ